MNASRIDLLGGWVVAIAIALAIAIATSAFARGYGAFASAFALVGRARGRGRAQGVIAQPGTASADVVSLSRGRSTSDAQPGGASAGVVSRSRNRSASVAERVTDWLVAYVAIAIALVQGLGFAGQFRLGVVLIALAVLACLGLLGGGWPALRAVASDFAACARAGVRSLPLLAAGVVGLALWVRAVGVRDVSWDGLLYHLTYPAVWIRHGGFAGFDAPGVWEQYESFPKGAEALYALVMLPLSADDLTYFVHVPLWLGTGCALYATARRVGCERLSSELAAACALASPAFGTFLGPANIEIPVAFAIAAAACAATRAIVAHDPAALTPCLLALGLGASLKVTSLAYLPFGLVVILACLRTAPARGCLRHAAVGALLGAVVAAPWYVNNLVQCSNPLYPAPLPGATSGPAAGTLANAWIVRESSVVAQRVVLDVVQTLAKTPWMVSYQGPGWLYLFTMFASTGVVLATWSRPKPLLRSASASHAGDRSSQRVRSEIHVLATAPSPDTQRLSGEWESSDAAAVPQSLRSGTYERGTARLARTLRLNEQVEVSDEGWPALSSPVESRVVLIAAVGFVGLAWVLTLLYLVMPWNGVFWAANARFLTPALLFALLGLAAATTAAPHWMSKAVWTAAVAVVVVSWIQPRYWGSLHATAPLDVARTFSHEPEHMRATTARNQIPFDAPLAGLWAYVEALPPSRIAYAIGGVEAQEGWVFYPFFGSSLQHDVGYVDIERAATPACQRRGVIRSMPDERAWLRRLGIHGIDWIALTGAPQELRWIEAHPELFTLTYRAQDHRVYARK